MPISSFPSKTKQFEIQLYEKPKDFEHLRENHIAFTGCPQKHPYDHDKIILVSDPYSANTLYYEFKTDDISFVEELATLVNITGQPVSMARIWIKKKSIAIRSTPFIVEDTMKYTQR